MELLSLYRVLLYYGLYFKATLPGGVVSCSSPSNQQHCGNSCVGNGWLSKVTSGRVNAQEICKHLGYSIAITEYGGNSGIQCKYPGTKYGLPNWGGGSLTSFGRTVSWKCEGGGKIILLVY